MLHDPIPRFIWYALLALLAVLFFLGERLSLSRNIVLILFVVSVLAGLYIFFGIFVIHPLEIP